MNGGCCRGHCSDGSEVRSSLLLCLLVLLALGLEQLVVGEKGLADELGLVLEPDAVPGLVLLHGVLQDHAI